MMGRKLQIKRGAKAALPPLESGELALTTDEKTLYYGTGAENIPVARKDHTHTAGEVGADPSGAAQGVANSLAAHESDNVKHISASDRTYWNGKAPLSYPSFIGTATVQSGSDYTNYKLRNAALVNSSPYSLSNGDIAFVYS